MDLGNTDQQTKSWTSGSEPTESSLNSEREQDKGSNAKEYAKYYILYSDQRCAFLKKCREYSKTLEK